MTIPADTPLGDRWIGPIIDEDDVLSEVVETNNATWIHLAVE